MELVSALLALAIYPLVGLASGIMVGRNKPVAATLGAAVGLVCGGTMWLFVFEPRFVGLIAAAIGAVVLAGLYVRAFRLRRHSQ
jgi:hypothetical protein